MGDWLVRARSRGFSPRSPAARTISGLGGASSAAMINRATAGLFAALLFLDASPGARGDVPVSDDSSEAQLMGFYAAALAFTPNGSPGGARYETGIEAVYLPSLSEEDRETTFAGAKVQNTNFTRVMPRPRLRWRPTEGWLLEGGFFPEAQVFGVTPRQYAFATAWRAAGVERRLGFWIRGHYLDADIEGPITCPEEAVEDPTNTVCFGGEVSADHFRPRAYGLDLVLEGRDLLAGGVTWYAAAGWIHQTLRFETHFVNIFGRLDDQRLVARLDRASVLGGVAWAERHGLRLTFEASYVPDALATVRLAITWAWGGP